MELFEKCTFSGFKICVPYIGCHPQWGLLFQPNASDAGVVHGPHVKKHSSSHFTDGEIKAWRGKEQRLKINKESEAELAFWPIQGFFPPNSACPRTASRGC